jgi:hypothetical protein
MAYTGTYADYIPDRLAGNPLANPWALCVLCSRQAGGLYYEPKHEANRSRRIYRACGINCLLAIERIVQDRKGGWPSMAALTEMEKKAIKEGKRSLYNSLVEIGKADHFADCSPEQMDRLVEAVWNGLQASMRQQSLDGDVPF